PRIVLRRQPRLPLRRGGAIDDLHLAGSLARWRAALAAARAFGHERYNDEDDHRDQPDDEERLDHCEDPAHGHEGKPDGEYRAEDRPYHPAHGPSMRPTPPAGDTRADRLDLPSK